MDLQLVDWHVMLSDLTTMGLAFLIALPIAWERERAHDSTGAGLRTFPIISVASCAFVLMGHSALGGLPEPMGRVLYGIMTGVGFIGGGAIVRSEAGVHGTATAAALWATGAIGAAVGFQRSELAVALSVMTFLMLRYARPFKQKPRSTP